MESNNEKEIEKTPFFQMVMDDYMLLLFIGVTIYACFYIIWGIMELTNLPPIPEAIKDALK